jgi:hypothetical protein
MTTATDDSNTRNRGKKETVTSRIYSHAKVRGAQIKIGEKARVAECIRHIFSHNPISGIGKREEGKGEAKKDPSIGGSIGALLREAQSFGTPRVGL